MRHKPIISSAIVVILIGGLASCVVFKTVTYFAPEPTAETKVLSTFRGLDEIASISLGTDTEMSAVLFDQPSSSTLRLIIHIPEGEHLQFVNNDIIARPSQGGAPTMARIFAIQGNIIDNSGVGRFVRFAPTDVLPGSTYRYRKMFGEVAIIHRSFETDVKFALSLPDQFEVDLPPVRMARGLVTLPPIRYRRKAGSAYQGAPP